MAVRALVIALAVFLAGFAVIGLHDSSECRDRSDVVLRLAIGDAVRTDATFVDRFIDDCRGSHLLAVAASALARKGRLSQAIRLSDEAIRREPRNHEGWLALSQTLRRRGLDAAADRALRRVRELNPRYETSTG